MPNELGLNSSSFREGTAHSPGLYNKTGSFTGSIENRNRSSSVRRMSRAQQEAENSTAAIVSELTFLVPRDLDVDRTTRSGSTSGLENDSDAESAVSSLESTGDIDNEHAIVESHDIPPCSGSVGEATSMLYESPQEISRLDGRLCVYYCSYCSSLYLLRIDTYLYMISTASPTRDKGRISIGSSAAMLESDAMARLGITKRATGEMTQAIILVLPFPFCILISCKPVCVYLCIYCSNSGSVGIHSSQGRGATKEAQRQAAGHGANTNRQCEYA